MRHAACGKERRVAAAACKHMPCLDLQAIHIAASRPACVRFARWEVDEQGGGGNGGGKGAAACRRGRARAHLYTSTALLTVPCSTVSGGMWVTVP